MMWIQIPTRAYRVHPVLRAPQSSGLASLGPVFCDGDVGQRRGIATATNGKLRRIFFQLTLAHPLDCLHIWRVRPFGCNRALSVEYKEFAFSLLSPSCLAI